MNIDENIIGNNEVITSKSSMEISSEKQKAKGEKDAWSELADNLEGKLNTLAKEAVDKIEDCMSCAIQTSLQSEDHKAVCEICNTVAEELEECKKYLALKTEIIKILLEGLAQAKADMDKCQHKIYKHNLTTTSRIASSEGAQWQNIRYRHSNIVGR
jgi:hypothetical protein